MKVIETEIEDLLILEPNVFGDDRGYFYESFHKERFASLGLPTEFVQTNISKSGKNVVRGLHFQKPPHEQGKLVTVMTGGVLDIAVDIRRSSPTYGKHVAVELTSENKRLFWVPPGFAHGFRTLADETIFYYSCTAPYNQPAEGGILWNDPDLNIDFGIADPVLSEKDKVAERFADFDSPFS